MFRSSMYCKIVPSYKKVDRIFGVALSIFAVTIVQRNSVVAMASSCTAPSGGSNTGSSMQCSASFMNSVTTNDVLYKTPLKLISIDDGNVVTESTTDVTFQDAATVESQKTAGSVASLVFVVRRPGCILCREHGQQLTQLIQNYPNPVTMWGIIKEVHVDDVGLSEFYKEYFTYPLYWDFNLAMYQAFGNRKLTLTTWNPIKLYRGYKDLSNRLSSKPNLAGNYKGEGMILGGILILDSTGAIRYAFEEDIGNALILDDIKSALDDVIAKSSTTKETVSTATSATESAASTSVASEL